MVELNLNHIYKKYSNAKHYSVEDFNLDIKDKELNKSHVGYSPGLLLRKVPYVGQWAGAGIGNDKATSQ